MSFAKQNSFDDRRQNSASAREAMLARFRARPSQDDPAVQARQAERQAIAEAQPLVGLGALSAAHALAKLELVGHQGLRAWSGKGHRRSRTRPAAEAGAQRRSLILALRAA